MDILQMIRGVWPDWELAGKLGEGSYGRLYNVLRQDLAGTSHAAVKVTRVPHDESERKALRLEGMSEEESRFCLSGAV